MDRQTNIETRSLQYFTLCPRAKNNVPYSHNCMLHSMMLRDWTELILATSITQWEGRKDGN